VKALKGLLDQLAQQSGMAEQLEVRGCLSLWPEVAGEDVAKATVAERVKDGVLYVRTRSSVWACELAFYRERFVAEINQRLGTPMIRDIRFRVGPVPEPTSPEAAPETPSEMEPELEPEAAKKVEDATASVKNEALRARIRSILVREFARRASHAGPKEGQ